MLFVSSNAPYPQTGRNRPLARTPVWRGNVQKKPPKVRHFASGCDLIGKPAIADQPADKFHAAQIGQFLKFFALSIILAEFIEALHLTIYKATFTQNFTIILAVHHSSASFYSH